MNAEWEIETLRAKVAELNAALSTTSQGNAALQKERDALDEYADKLYTKVQAALAREAKLLEERKHIRYLITMAYAKLYNAKFSLKDPALMSQIEKYLQGSSDHESRKNAQPEREGE